MICHFHHNIRAWAIGRPYNGQFLGAGIIIPFAMFIAVDGLRSNGRIIGAGRFVQHYLCPFLHHLIGECACIVLAYIPVGKCVRLVIVVLPGLISELGTVQYPLALQQLFLGAVQFSRYF